MNSDEDPNSVVGRSVAEETNHETHATATRIQCNRIRARDGLIQQAERMLKRSRVENSAANPGDNVTLPIPLVDRGRGDPRNIIGVVLDRDENDMYRIAVRHGVLKGKYSRNQFNLCSQVLFPQSDMNTSSEIPLRNAVQMQSNCGGQGFLKCNCLGQNRCQTVASVIKQD